MDPIVPPKFQYGQVERPDFFVNGDLFAAYQYLKEQFEPIKDSKSGGIKRMTEEELAREKKKPQEDFVKNLPPTQLH